MSNTDITRIIEVHSPLGAVIAEHAKTEGREFHGFWSSSLTDSSLQGLPDNELLNLSTRIQGINSIFNVTTKPMIVDADTGGHAEHFGHIVKVLEREGVSGVVIEDKQGLKRNSLHSDSKIHLLADEAEFAEKIKKGKDAQKNADFMIFARLEGLILGFSVDEICARAVKFVEAGSDGLVIHSKDSNPQKLLEAGHRLRLKFPHIPLVAIPSAYPQVTEEELQSAGFNIVIYANHMLRASIVGMEEVTQRILQHRRALEADQICIPVSELLSMTEDDLPNVRFRSEQ